MVSDASKSKMRPARRVAAALLVLAALALGCTTTRQPRGEPEKSGFLGDYSMLEEGERGQAGLVYIAPDADFARYDAIHLDSVSFWHDGDTEGVSPEDQQMLTDYLFAAVHLELSKDYRMVEEPGPRVMRIRIAITEAKGSRVLADTVTSVVPQLRTLATLGGLASDTRVFVGAAAVEMEIVDSVTGKRLAAAVDERWGTKAIRGGILEWSDAKEAFDHWARQLRTRLAERSGRA